MIKYLGVAVKYFFICLSRTHPVVLVKTYNTIIEIVWCILTAKERLISSLPDLALEMVSESIAKIITIDPNRIPFKARMSHFTRASRLSFVACRIWKVFKRHIEALYKFYQV
jgi:hypothetical protein